MTEAQGMELIEALNQLMQMINDLGLLIQVIVISLWFMGFFMLGALGFLMVKRS